VKVWGGGRLPAWWYCLTGVGGYFYNSTRVWLDQYRFEGWLALLEEPYK
jgi:hypothetical protein